MLLFYPAFAPSGPSVRRFLLTLCVFLLGTTPLSALDRCAVVIDVPLDLYGLRDEPFQDDASFVGGQVSMHGIETGDLFYRVKAPTAGLLTLDVVSTESVRLVPIVDPCRLLPGVAPAVVSHGSGLAVAAMDAGTHYFRLAARDPRQALGAHQLIVGFVEDSTLATDQENDETDQSGEDPDEIEIEPDLFVAEPVVDEPLRSLCRGLRADDHGDAWLCATPLSVGRTLKGYLQDGPSSWDRDLFVFTLETASTVDLWGAGAADTLALFDVAGRLEAKAEADGGGFRMSRYLDPGTYWVQLGGQPGAAGPYELNLTVKDWR